MLLKTISVSVYGIDAYLVEVEGLTITLAPPRFEKKAQTWVCPWPWICWRYGPILRQAAGLMHVSRCIVAGRCTPSFFLLEVTADKLFGEFSRGAKDFAGHRQLQP